MKSLLLIALLALPLHAADYVRVVTNSATFVKLGVSSHLQQYGFEASYDLVRWTEVARHSRIKTND